MLDRIPASRLAMVTVIAALSVGCAARTEDTRPTAQESGSMTPGSSPSFSLSTDQPSPAPDEGDTLTGALGADAVEGGCAYLRLADGSRYEVIYPHGWTVTMSPLALTDPDGNVVARGGEEVTVRGSQATDMASICQIGPIFRASEVVIP
jgi:hypothetical protein